MTFTAGSRTARATAASTSSGIGGTIVFRCSGRLSVIVATAPSVPYRSVWKELMRRDATPRRTNPRPPSEKCQAPGGARHPFWGWGLLALAEHLERLHLAADA